MRQRVFYGWWIVLSISIALIFGVSAAFYTASVFLEPIEESLGWTKTQISLGFTIAALVAAAASPFVGLAISKLGGRKVLVFGAILTGFALALLSLIQQPWHYYALMLFMAVGISCLGLISGTTVISDWFVERRGTATGIIFAASGIGGMLMVFLASRSVEIIGWRPTFILLGSGLFVIVLPALLAVVRNKPYELNLEPDGGQPAIRGLQDFSDESGLNLGQAVRTFPYWLMAFLMLCYAVAFGSMAQHAIALLRSLGVDRPSLFWSLTLGVSVLGRLTFGMMADRVSRKALISVTWLLHLVGLGLAPLTPGSVGLVWGFVLCYGLGQGAFGTVFPVRLSELFGTEHFSKLYGTALLFQAIGFSIGAVLFGKIYDSFGSYGPALQTVAAMSLVCVLASAMVRHPSPALATQTG